MFKPHLKIAFVIFIGLIATACDTTKSVPDPQATAFIPLRVGITPDYPPVIFKTDNKILGIEVDLAFRLADQLDRQVQFVELLWESQIPALLRNEIDIIMSGMSVTPARQVRIVFSEPYHQIKLWALVRAKDSSKYASMLDIKQNAPIIGVKRGTTGDAFVTKNFPSAQKIEFEDPTFAPSSLVRERVDVFVHDEPAILWLASENESELVPIPLDSPSEYLAWGMRRGDLAFMEAVNSILQGWKDDGTLNYVLQRWGQPKQRMQ